MSCHAYDTIDQGEAASWIDRYLGELASAGSPISRHVPRCGLIELLARHGNPQQELRCVRIAGSKGKGSTALILEAILHRAGQRVGVFTSPHVDHWCERIRLSGQPIMPELLAEVLAELAPDVAELRARHGRGPGFFEVCLAAALIVFARQSLDIVILEAGIGAATDATAIATADLAVLTTVEAEHLDVIGPTLEDVAREKAGVIGPGQPAVVGRLPEAAVAEVERQAATHGATLYRLGHDFDITRDTAQSPVRLSYRESFYRLSLAVMPTLYWLADNTALAIAAARRLAISALDSRVIAAALVELQLPARLEHLGEAPVLLADSAHTQASSALLAQYLEGCEQTPRILVVAFSFGHGPGALSPALWHQVDRIVVTCADPLRSQAAIDVAHELEKTGRAVAHVEANPLAALAEAARLAGAGGLVCAAGSVYLAARMRDYVRRLARIENARAKEAQIES